MEFERINDDTIRVLITKRDLDDRGVSITDLMGNQEETEQFFYGILEEANVDYDFLKNSDGAVSFQVIPSRNGLEVFISNHMPDPDTMDALVKSVTSEGTDGQDVVEGDNDDAMTKELLNKLLATDATEEDSEPANRVSDRLTRLSDQEVNPDHEDMPEYVFLKLKNFEDVLALAQVVSQGIQDSVLYKQADAYYLKLIFQDDLSRADRQNILSVALEYGKLSPIDADVLAEHGQVIFEQSALAQLNQYFN
ncbi:adapter protein MecA 1/2 [Weissella uvarum]|uniref:adaptor protein MecA n=1 Tax=Weissella uvarum TaxID=1479233 RepID=UPI00196100D6|nr:adaptor protein MecA [Weissella uvarum]MBM7617738.1 adapter protein MecA 1/2 [Weissella uvarum]MCM0595883.1 adaptor protein MecA [Weissella uvarum]